jgi:predicted outer membrane repeat protein
MSSSNLRLATGGVATFQASELRDGTAAFGAGIAATSGASITLTSCVLAGNIASLLGGGIYAQGTEGDLRNVTLDGNRGTRCGRSGG